MQHNASLESENAELRAELAAAHAVVDATAAAAARGQAPEPAAIIPRQGHAMISCDVEQYKDTGLRLLELAQHSALIAAAYQVSWNFRAVRGECMHVAGSIHCFAL